MRLAFTGFGPFPGVTENPTASLIEALHGADDPAFADCSFDVLEVAYDAVGPAIERVLAQRPRALVMTGYSRHAAAIQLESVGTSARAQSVDAAGFMPAAAKGVATRLACPHIDFAALAAALGDAGIPAQVSEDAGQYVCNHTLYTALTQLAETGCGTPALFVHIPAIAGTQLAEASAGALSLSDLVRAMGLIARVLVPELQPIQHGK